jgi:hypothetical protein
MHARLTERDIWIAAREIWATQQHSASIQARTSVPSVTEEWS